MTARSADATLLRRAALRVGLQTAAAVAVTIGVLVAITLLVVLRGQHREQAELITAAVTRADDVTTPPAGVWLIVDSGAARRATPGLPAGFPQEKDLRNTARDGVTRDHHVTVHDTEYEVRTQQRGEDVVQGVLSLADAHRERARLVEALLLCGGAGLLVAALAGVWLGRRAVTPLASALALQYRFVADAGHELRTPLTLLSTRAQLVRRDLARDVDPAELRSEVDGLVTDANRLAAILEDLLLAADPRADTPRLPLSLAELAGEEVAAARSVAAEHGIAIRFEPVTGSSTVDGSAAGLRRAVNALLDNAIRHADQTVSLALKASGSQVVLEVADDGPGIDPALLPKLFNRFASGSDGQPGRGRRRYGLGLALVSEIAARHGGGVSARTEPGGAVLRLTLPRARAFQENSQERPADFDG